MTRHSASDVAGIPVAAGFLLGRTGTKRDALGSIEVSTDRGLSGGEKDSFEKEGKDVSVAVVSLEIEQSEAKDSGPRNVS